MNEDFKNTPPNWDEQPFPNEQRNTEEENIERQESVVNDELSATSADQEETAASAEESSAETVEAQKSAGAPAEEQPAYQAPPASQNQWQSSGSRQGFYQQNPYQPSGYYTPNGGQHYYGGQQWQQNQQPRQEFQWNSNQYAQPQPPQQPPQKPKKNKGLIVFSVILVVALVFTAGAFAIFAITQQPGELTGDASTVVNSGPNLEINSRPANNEDKTSDGKLTDTAIAKKVKPSVVGIVVYVKTGWQYQMYGQGSGIIMSEDGYIISNAHVFTTEQGKVVDSVQVYLDNGKSYAGDIVGLDTRSDLAVIKIQAKNLTAAEFGDSTTVEVGEHVLAIGNPSGMELAGSVTGGMVSAVNRQVRSSNGFSMTCIQTDAAINPGNSGGALVNTYGQVIGINSSKIVANDYEGIGFAIAISEAKPIVDSLIKNGYVEGRVKIGITYIEVDEFNAKLNDCPQGLCVEGIDSTLPVAKSGLQVGDIITKMDGKDTRTTEEVSTFLKSKKPGDVVKMTVYRMTDIGKGHTLTVNVALAEDKGTSNNNNNQNN